MMLFTKNCECGNMIFGPREGGKARGRWLGYDTCLECRKKEQLDKAKNDE